MSSVPGSAISIADGEITIDAGLLASKLGLTAEALKVGMRGGTVYSVAETGLGEDAGRTRLTFRYRTRVWIVVVDPDGVVIENPADLVAPPTHTDRLSLIDFVGTAT